MKISEIEKKYYGDWFCTALAKFDIAHYVPEEKVIPSLSHKETLILLYLAEEEKLRLNISANILKKWLYYYYNLVLFIKKFDFYSQIIDLWPDKNK